MLTQQSSYNSYLVKKIENSCNKMQQMTEEISKIKETSVKNGDVLMKIEKADSIPKKGFYGPVTGAALGVKMPLGVKMLVPTFVFSRRKPKPKKKDDEISNADLFLKLKSSINHKLQIELESVVNKVTDLVGSNVDTKLGCPR